MENQEQNEEQEMASIASTVELNDIHGSRRTELKGIVILWIVFDIR